MLSFATASYPLQRKTGGDHSQLTYKTVLLYQLSDVDFCTNDQYVSRIAAILLCGCHALFS